MRFREVTGRPDIGSLSVDALNAALGARFVVGRRLGIGGQGAVFLAMVVAGDLASRQVALKIHSPDGNDERVDREIRALTHIKSPHLARALEHGLVSIGGQTHRWVSWEYIEGQSLRERLDRSGALSLSEVFDLLRHVSTAIQSLWDSRIVHRDIKPANLIFDPTRGVWVLVDLGLARFLNETSISQPGSWCGTPGYMSPEQAWGERRLTVHSDVFALGVTALEAHAGVHPTGYVQARLMPPSANIATPIRAVPVLGDLLFQLVQHDPIARPVPLEVLDTVGDA